MATTMVYRCFDAEGVLLYVGCSDRVEARFEQHLSLSHWAHRVASIDAVPYPDRRSALDAERKAIRSEDPRCNVLSRSRDRRHWTRDHYVDWIASCRSSMGSEIVRRRVAAMTAEMTERFSAVSA